MRIDEWLESLAEQESEKKASTDLEQLFDNMSIEEVVKIAGADEVRTAEPERERSPASRLVFMEKVARQLAREKTASLIGGGVGYLSQGDPEATPRSGFWRGFGGGLLGGTAGLLGGAALGGRAGAIGGSLIGQGVGGYLGGRSAKATNQEKMLHDAKQKALSDLAHKELRGGEKRSFIEGGADLTAPGMEKVDEFTSPEAKAKARVLSGAMKATKNAPSSIRKGAVRAAGRQMVKGAEFEKEGSTKRYGRIVASMARKAKRGVEIP